MSATFQTSLCDQIGRSELAWTVDAQNQSGMDIFDLRNMKADCNITHNR